MSPIDFLFHSMLKVPESITTALCLLGFLGISLAKRVSRTHSSGSRRSNDDVRSIAIQYRYLRSFHRNEEHISTSYVFRAQPSSVRRIHDLVSHPRLCFSCFEIPIFSFSPGTQTHSAIVLLERSFGS